MGSAPIWNWMLARSSDMSIIAELSSITSRSITPQLNAAESASFTISVLDQAAPLIQKVSTCIRCFRDGNEVWSGPVWTKAPSGARAQMQVGCVGWFEGFNHRLLKTNSNNPDTDPNGAGTATATSIQYTAMDQCAIAADLVSRTIYDADSQGAPNYVSLGSVPSNTQSRNLVVQQYQNIGQQLTTLSQLEAGFDFRVDPTTRQFNMYYNPVWPVGGPYTVQGRGQVRPNAIWGFKKGPDNLADVRPTEDADKIGNEVYAVGQYATGEGSWPGSIQTLGLFTTQSSISDQVTTEVLTAFAQAQATTNAYGITVYSFDQMPSGTPSVLTPFVDFDIGDFGYLMANYGSIQIPDPAANFSGPQPVRIFAFTLNISDESVETVTNFQTVFTQVA
jgi:hypothetical protein